MVLWSFWGDLSVLDTRCFWDQSLDSSYMYGPKSFETLRGIRSTEGGNVGVERSSSNPESDPFT